MSTRWLFLVVPLLSALEASCDAGDGAGADLLGPEEDAVGGPVNEGASILGDASTRRRDDGSAADARTPESGGDHSLDSSTGDHDGTRPGDAREASAPDGGASGGEGTLLPCGTAMCAIPLEACCVQRVDDGLATSCNRTCTALGEGAELRCGSAANCPANTVCCLGKGDGKARASTCRASCGGETQLCDPSAAQSGCPDDAPCATERMGGANLPATVGSCGRAQN